ncbi:helix-turn-helix transcriptional regulator [Phenylobacterium sp.]|uniref:helix-turn-helix transcriptional regulator n=1 Tax=Phenylobacterium sp. TaxID=1871053 RepID=UPI00301DE791
MGPADVVFSLADRFYEAVEDPEAMPHALTALALAAGGHHAVTAQQGHGDGRWGAVAGNMDPALSGRMVGALDSDPVRVWLSRFPQAGWDRMCRLVPTQTPLSRALYASRFYADFVEPLDGHHAALTSVDLGETRSFLSVFRPERLGDYEPEAMQVLEGVRPHLARAFRLARRLAEAENGLFAAFGMLDRLSSAVVLLDRRLQLIFANREALALAQRSDVFTLDERGLRLRSPRPARELSAMLLAAGGDRAPPDRPLRLRVARATSPFPLLLQVERLETPGLRAGGACVGIFIDDPGAALAADADALADAFGLTPREAALTAVLARGRSPREAAVELEMSEATARTHLKRILDKAGAHRQAELVSLVAGLIRR